MMFEGDLMSDTETPTRPDEPAWLARVPEAQRAAIREGRSRRDPRRFGVLAPVIGGFVFVDAGVSAAGLAPWGILLRVLALILAAACVVQLFVRPGALGPPGRMPPTALLIWVLGIVAMIVGINLAGTAARNAGMEHLQPAINAAFVGAHFIPYAWAFAERMIAWLGLAVGTIGVLGVLSGLAFGAPWAAVAAIVAGFVQMGIVLAWTCGRLQGGAPRLTRRSVPVS